MRWAGVPLKKRTTHAIAMPGTATCCCTSGVMTGGKSREWRKMTSDASAMTGQNRTVTSLHECMTVVVIHLWQNSPRRTATVSCRTIWVRPYKPSTARVRWFGTASSTSMEMYWNSEVRGILYPLGSKVCMRMGKLGCTTIASDTILLRWGTTSVKIQLD